MSGDPSTRPDKRRVLTAEQVRAIRADLRSYALIASDYNVSKSTIAGIKKRRWWKRLTEESRVA